MAEHDTCDEQANLAGESQVDTAMDTSDAVLDVPVERHTSKRRMGESDEDEDDDDGGAAAATSMSVATAVLDEDDGAGAAGPPTTKQRLEIQSTHPFNTYAEAMQHAFLMTRLTVGGIHITEATDEEESTEQRVSDLVRGFRQVNLDFNMLNLIKHMDRLAHACRLMPVANEMEFTITERALVSDDASRSRGVMYSIDEAQRTVFKLTRVSVVTPAGTIECPKDEYSMPSLRVEPQWYAFMLAVVPDLIKMFNGGHADSEYLLGNRMSGTRRYLHVTSTFVAHRRLPTDTREARMFKDNGWPCRYTIDMNELVMPEPAELVATRWPAGKWEQRAEMPWRKQPYLNPHDYAYHPDLQAWLVLAPWFQAWDDVITKFAPNDPHLITPYFLTITVTESLPGEDGIRAGDARPGSMRGSLFDPRDLTNPVVPILPIFALNEMLMNMVESSCLVSRVIEYIQRWALNGTIVHFHELDTERWARYHLMNMECDRTGMFCARRHVPHPARFDLLFPSISLQDSVSPPHVPPPPPSSLSTQSSSSPPMQFGDCPHTPALEETSGDAVGKLPARTTSSVQEAPVDDTLVPRTGSRCAYGWVHVSLDSPAPDLLSARLLRYPSRDHLERHVRSLSVASASPHTPVDAAAAPDTPYAVEEHGLFYTPCCNLTVVRKPETCEPVSTGDVFTSALHGTPLM